MSNNVVSILSNVSNKEMTPFMQLFWQQQKKMLQKKCQRNSLPSSDNLLLSLATKSPFWYEELRNSGVFVLPRQRTLRGYRNAIRPKVGFNAEVIKDLIALTTTYFNTQVCCVTFL